MKTQTTYKRLSVLSTVIGLVASMMTILWVGYNWRKESLLKKQGNAGTIDNT